MWSRKVPYVPVVIHHQHFDADDRWRWLKVAVLKRADAVVTISYFSRRQLQALGVGRVHVVPCGVGPEYRPAIVDRDRPIVLFLGELKARKNVPFLLRAWVHVRRQVPNAMLWVAGDGPDWPRVQRTAMRLGLLDSVAFMGTVSECMKPALYRMAAVFAFPSLMEGFGLPVLEAMASGLPVVCSDRGALPERFEHGKGGWRAALEDGPEAFADLIAALLVDADVRRAMGAVNVAAARAFSWDESARRLEAILESVRR